MKTRMLAVSLWLVIIACPVGAQTSKVKVAYPTTVGSMAVLWMTKEAKLFEKHGLEVELIYVAGSSRVVQAMIGKYSRISDPEALEETYQHYAVRVMPRVPYPTTTGIQMVLDEIGVLTPEAKSLPPENIIDVSYLKELEQGGFIKKLYGEK
jgi:ABC-type nitrate/sulfonate/bicarbonate transport system substrate-binding protein